MVSIEWNDQNYEVVEFLEFAQIIIDVIFQDMQILLKYIQYHRLFQINASVGYTCRFVFTLMQYFPSCKSRIWLL